MRRWSELAQAAGGDSAFLGFPVPDRSTMNYCRGEVHVVSQAKIDVNDVMVYGVEGWILQTDDPETDMLNINTLWDSSVPKDDNATAFDTTQATDTDEVFDPGQVSLPQLFEQELFNPERVFQRHKIVSLASNPTGFVPGTPDEFYATDMFAINIRQPYRVNMDSAMLFGISSPNLGEAADDNVIPTVGGTVTGGFWMLRYLQEFMDKAAIDMLGAVEAGAETPYDTIINFLLGILDKFNAKAGAGFAGITLQMTAKCTAGIDVPGRFSFGTIGPNAEG